MRDGIGCPVDLGSEASACRIRGESSRDMGEKAGREQGLALEGGRLDSLGSGLGDDWFD